LIARDDKQKDETKADDDQGANGDWTGSLHPQRQRQGQHHHPGGKDQVKGTFYHHGG